MSRLGNRYGDDRLADDAKIIASADHFEIALFLGTGKFAKAEANDVEKAREAAKRLLAENPACTRRPIIYAVTAEGRAAPISNGAPS